MRFRVIAGGFVVIRQVIAGVKLYIVLISLFPHIRLRGIIFDLKFTSLPHISTRSIYRTNNITRV